MKKQILISAILMLLLTACNTNGPDSTNGEENMFGEWELSHLRVDGKNTNRVNQGNVIVRLILHPPRTGQIFVEDFGRIRSHLPIFVSWSVENNFCRLEIAEGDLREFQYTLDYNQLTFQYSDGENFIECIYRK